MTEELARPTRAPFKWNHPGLAYTPSQNALVADMGRWAEKGDCRENSLFLIDLENVRGQEHAELTEALAYVCQGCPVRINCLTHAMRFPERFGFWGGYTAEQRKALRKTGIRIGDIG